MSHKFKILVLLSEESSFRNDCFDRCDFVDLGGMLLTFYVPAAVIFSYAEFVVVTDSSDSELYYRLKYEYKPKK